MSTSAWWLIALFLGIIILGIIDLKFNKKYRFIKERRKHRPQDSLFQDDWWFDKIDKVVWEEEKKKLKKEKQKKKQEKRMKKIKIS